MSTKSSTASQVVKAGKVTLVVVLISTNIFSLVKTNRLEDTLEDVVHDRDVAEARVSVLNNSVDSLKVSIKKLEGTNQDLEKTVSQLKKENDSLSNERDGLKKELASRPKAVKADRGGASTSSRGGYMDYKATGYCPCVKCCGKWAGGPTKSGVMPSAGRTIAADPRVLPQGTRVYIEGLGERVVEDTGSAIKGKLIDIYFNSHQEASNWGRRSIKLKILN